VIFCHVHAGYTDFIAFRVTDFNEYACKMRDLNGTKMLKCCQQCLVSMNLFPVVCVLRLFISMQSRQIAKVISMPNLIGSMMEFWHSDNGHLKDSQVIILNRTWSSIDVTSNACFIIFVLSGLAVLNIMTTEITPAGIVAGCRNIDYIRPLTYWFVITQSR